MATNAVRQLFKQSDTIQLLPAIRSPALPMPSRDAAHPFAEPRVRRHADLWVASCRAGSSCPPCVPSNARISRVFFQSSSSDGLGLDRKLGLQLTAPRTSSANPTSCGTGPGESLQPCHPRHSSAVSPGQLVRRLGQTIRLRFRIAAYRLPRWLTPIPQSRLPLLSKSPIPMPRYCVSCAECYCPRG